MENFLGPFIHLTLGDLISAIIRHPFLASFSLLRDRISIFFLADYEHTALPHYFETKILKIKLRWERKIRNLQFSIFSKSAARSSHFFAVNML